MEFPGLEPTIVTSGDAGPRIMRASTTVFGVTCRPCRGPEQDLSSAPNHQVGEVGRSCSNESSNDHPFHGRWVSSTGKGATLNLRPYVCDL